MDAPAVTARQKRVSLVGLLLGVSPALFVATRGVNALALGAAILAVLALSTVLVSLIGASMSPRGRLLLHIFVVAVLVTGADFALRALAPAVRRELGFYLQLSASGCVIVGREAAQRPARELGRTLAQVVGAGLGIGLSLLGVACVREALGYGTVTLVPVGSFRGVFRIAPLARHPAAVALQAAGALLIAGFLLGLARLVALRRGKT